MRPLVVCRTVPGGVLRCRRALRFSPTFWQFACRTRRRRPSMRRCKSPSIPAARRRSCACPAARPPRNQRRACRSGRLAAAAAASQTAFVPSQTDSAAARSPLRQPDRLWQVQTASKIAPNSAFIEAVEDAQPAGRGPLGPQPVFVTQAIIPELESPTLINPEPPPLFMPQNGPSWCCRNRIGSGFEGSGLQGRQRIPEVRHADARRSTR